MTRPTCEEVETLQAIANKDGIIHRLCEHYFALFNELAEKDQEIERLKKGYRFSFKAKGLPDEATIQGYIFDGQLIIKVNGIVVGHIPTGDLKPIKNIYL